MYVFVLVTSSEHFACGEAYQYYPVVRRQNNDDVGLRDNVKWETCQNELDKVFGNVDRVSMIDVPAGEPMASI